jgi:uncharacterized protein (DUF433 family)
MSPRITLSAQTRNGQPTIRGMRITVYDVLKMLASGMSHEAIIADFPELVKEDVDACLMYASHREYVSMRSLYEITPRSKSFA